MNQTLRGSSHEDQLSIVRTSERSFAEEGIQHWIAGFRIAKKKMFYARPMRGTAFMTEPWGMDGRFRLGALCSNIRTGYLGFRVSRRKR
jgi:hypothetical protein